MSFRLKRALALKVCADQVQSLIARPLFRNTTWTQESLFHYLEGIGLDYTLQEVGIINDELHNRGIVEDVEE